MKHWIIGITLAAILLVALPITLAIVGLPAKHVGPTGHVPSMVQTSQAKH